MVPRLTSGWPKTADSEAMMMSQLMASSQPPPRAKPLTAAITGLDRWLRRSRSTSRSCARPANGVASTISLMSAPAANARSPPVMMKTRMESSRSSSSRASHRSLQRP